MSFRFLSERQRGITLIEILVAIVILAILAAISFTFFVFLNKKSSLENNVQEIINILRLAQNRTISSEGASQYGVYFDTSALPHKYTLFKGNNYAGREVSADIIQEASRNVEIYELNLGGPQEVVFSRVSGEASPAGDIKLRLISDNSQTETIYIKNSGQVSLVDVVPPVATNLKDSRHVHLDLGWSILDATQLKFFFPNAGSTIIADMASGFIGAEFNWEGEFSVAGNTQSFKVHTHLLDPLTPPFTELCIHRDRNNGKNNQKVIIYINDGGIDKEIITYQNDVDDSVIKGLFAESLESQ